eukprot:COSAG06_NODE_35621_length_457_cov_8.740223_1_plen_60_part_10
MWSCEGGERKRTRINALLDCPETCLTSKDAIWYDGLTAWAGCTIVGFALLGGALTDCLGW